MKCYLCGSTENLTEDHVPAKTFFPKPRPDNLIWVWCCETCHRPLTKDNEAFRTWVMSAATTNPAANQLLKDGVLQRTLDRNPTMHSIMLNHIGEMPVLTRYGVAIAPTLNFPLDRAERFIIRVTKAMLSKFHSNYDYSRDSFVIKHLGNMTKDQVACVEEMRMQFLYDFRGDKVFEFWRGLSDTGGGWVFIFYEAVGFVVFHRHNPDVGDVMDSSERN